MAGRHLPACRAPLACSPLKTGALVGTALGYCTDTPNDMDQVGLGFTTLDTNPCTS